jgi:hypothetical protein
MRSPTLRRHKTEGMSDPQTPPTARAIFEHTLPHLEAQMRWLETLREGLVKKSK